MLSDIGRHSTSLSITILMTIVQVEIQVNLKQVQNSDIIIMWQTLSHVQLISRLENSQKPSVLSKCEPK